MERVVSTSGDVLELILAGPNFWIRLRDIDALTGATQAGCSTGYQLSA